jgi:protein-tyrosine kinase
MLIPKASHLVERVAERLLRSGALDDPDAQSLRRPGTDTTKVDASAPLAADVAAAPASVEAEVKVRSTLFARVATAKPVMAGSALGDAPDDDDESPVAEGTVHLSPPSALVALSPAILGQVRPLGGLANHTAVLERPADLAASMLQGPLAVDAVSLERAGMVDWSRPPTSSSEEFRLVQHQIIRSAFGPGAEPGFSNLLLVTSARPGEGKSFMSTDLSGSIARQGDHHVLLVDADSKRDSICYSLGLAQARGLLDLAANPKLDPSPLIAKTPIERLSILPVGRERERSAELFSTKEMTRLIQSLGRRYADRLLILDAPPCLSTSDPAVLAQVVGQILFVVEADRTQRDEIEASLDLIQACPTITMVLNKQQISSRYTFGAYSSYYSS